MNRSSKLFGCVLILVHSISISLTQPSEQSIATYLKEAKACYQINGTNQSTGDKLYDRLVYILENVSQEDYIDHRFDESDRRLSIGYLKKLKGTTFVIRLHAYLNKVGCDRFEIYEVVS